MELLKTDGVSKVFGGLKAVSNFDIEINEGELIGQMVQGKQLHLIY